MRTVSFRNGEKLAWNFYRELMLGRLGPAAVIKATRRAPVVGALDAALPRRYARDQNGGKLSQAYCDATEKFLGDNGVDPDDVAGIMKVLSQYVEEAPAEDGSPESLKIGGTRGQVGAHDRRMALDQFDPFGRPRNLPATPMPPGGNCRTILVVRF